MSDCACMSDECTDGDDDDEGEEEEEERGRVLLGAPGASQAMRVPSCEGCT